MRSAPGGPSMTQVDVSPDGACLDAEGPLDRRHQKRPAAPGDRGSAYSSSEARAAGRIMSVLARMPFLPIMFPRATEVPCGEGGAASTPINSASLAAVTTGCLDVALRSRGGLPRARPA